ncbi:MAG: serine/threonine protein kinase [Planctomycetes bacterium]|nr:serine/threonine protein kinase [Planctomycetota bacterium]
MTLSERNIAQLRDLLRRPDTDGTRYEVLEPLAQGGMGEVYVARDRLLDRRVALKVVRGLESGPGLDERLDAEAKTLARLEHPSIVPIYDVGRLPDGRAFYAMKLVEGKTLESAAEVAERVNDRLRLFARLCEVVAFAHERGVIHRDLKPQNVMVGPFGELYVLDFGVAKTFRAERTDEPIAGGAASASDTRAGSVIGTPEYMPPEQAAGRSAEVDSRSDVFALGRILTFLAAGSPREERAASLPSPLRSILHKATAEDPAHRYGSALDLGRDVLQFLDGDRPSAHRETWIEWLRRHAERHQTVLWLIAAYLALRVAILWSTGR